MAYTPDNGIVAYRQAIALAAIAAGVPQLRGVLTVYVEAVFDRPKSHLLASGVPRTSAPPVPLRADWDNIGKGVCDAIFENDSYVADGRCRKRYARDGERAHTTVTITEDIEYAAGIKPPADADDI
jgi:Holliday junction resolvase RusA-like endonuclease